MSAVAGVPAGDSPIASLCEWVLGPTQFEDVCRVAREGGLDGVHLRGDRRPQDADWIRAAAETAGVRFLGMTPAILWPRDGADLSNPDPDVRARGLAYYRDLVDLAAQLHVPAIEVVPACEGRLEALSSSHEEWELAVESLRRLAEHAADSGVALAVEPLNRYETYLVTRVEQAAEMVSAVGAERMGVVADAFHMSIEERDPLAAVAAVGPLLTEVQLADSNRRAPGLGHLDVSGIVRAARAAGYRGPWVMEFLPRDAEVSGPAHQLDLESFRAELEAAMESVLKEIEQEQ
jgi:sugar phosphate isomerase/epimerase